MSLEDARDIAAIMVIRGQMPPQARWVVEPDQVDGDDGGANAMLSQIGPR